MEDEDVVDQDWNFVSVGHFWMTDEIQVVVAECVDVVVDDAGTRHSELEARQTVCGV